MHNQGFHNCRLYSSFSASYRMYFPDSLKLTSISICDIDQTVCCFCEWNEMYPMGTGIAVVLNIIYFLIDFAGVGGEAVANIPAHSMAIT